MRKPRYPRSRNTSRQIPLDNLPDERIRNAVALLHYCRLAGNIQWFYLGSGECEAPAQAAIDLANAGYGFRTPTDNDGFFRLCLRCRAKGARK